MLYRVLLTVGTLLFAGVFYALMLKGWKNRQRRQGDLPAPRLPEAASRTVLGPVEGLYVGTTSELQWLDRIAVHQLSERGVADATVAEDGLHLEREGSPDLWVPLTDITAVGIEQALAGKVVSGGMLVVSWRLGPRVVTSGFRATDHRQHPRLRDALTALLPVEAT